MKRLQGMLDFVVIMWAFRYRPAILLAFLRVLAWPPSRKRYDAARLAKDGELYR